MVLVNSTTYKFILSDTKILSNQASIPFKIDAMLNSGVVKKYFGSRPFSKTESPHITAISQEPCFIFYF